LVIGAALAPQPDILILDEPTSGLDALHMRRLADLLDREASKGTPVVVVTHDLEFIRACCNRILLLSKGQAACFSPVNRPAPRINAFFSPGLDHP
jgi:ABC-type multidrug transport system ATPase subunit